MESRVLRRAFERLELLEGKLSRAVLRGGGGGNVTSLPDSWGVTPTATRPLEGRLAAILRCWRERAALDAVDVQPAVAVVVEQGNAPGHRLGELATQLGLHVAATEIVHIVGSMFPG